MIKSQAYRVGAFLCALGMMLGNLASAEVSTIEEYNEKLPVWGVSWTAGDASMNGYYPSFYTGFAPRVQTPDRIHIRVARGNQTRVSLILDQTTVFDYLYDLKARSEFYNQLVADNYINVAPNKAAIVPHLQYFNSVLNSGLLNATEDFEARKITKEQLYIESMNVLRKLNAQRVFDVKINLADAFLNWRDQNLATAKSVTNAQDAMVLVNLILLNRVNLARNLKDSEVQALANLKDQSQVLSDEGFVLETYKLFESVTDGKYDVEVLNADQKFVPAKTCNSIDDCVLAYTEFTTIYPTGSLKASTRDGFQNSINRYATPGLANFTDEGSRSAVDNIRSEPYYGFAPKMDYEQIGNGFHNPAVRLWPNASFKEALNIPKAHQSFWPVRRGGVSSGCLRLPIGHIWELRHLMPVENSKMKQVFYFGNNSVDFDIYDLTGSGQASVMGVSYYIKYELKGSSGLDKREGQGLEASADLVDYYASLFGKKNVLDESTLSVINPSISIQTTGDLFSRVSNGRVKTSYVLKGHYPLYEQSYEKDKVQFYTSGKIKGFNSGLTGGGSRTLSKRFVRLLGRVKGCAPFADQNACGAQAFLDEKKQIFAEIK